MFMCQEQKEIEFYAASLNAWLNTKLERDKSLLALSSGALGLLITLISTIGVTSIESLVLHILALMCFVLSLSSVLWVLGRNATHLQRIVLHDEKNDALLDTLDKTAVVSFIAGVVFTSVIGVSVAISKYVDKESVVSEKKSQGTPGIGMDSFNQFSTMRPSQRDGAKTDTTSQAKPIAQPSTSSGPSSQNKK